MLRKILSRGFYVCLGLIRPVLSRHGSFLLVKHSKFSTCWQQVSRRVTHLARLKFQLRTRRISATPVAKRFEFASEQYFPRSIAMFGLISGIIMSLSRARVASRFIHARTHIHTASHPLYF